ATDPVVRRSIRLPSGSSWVISVMMSAEYGAFSMGSVSSDGSTTNMPTLKSARGADIDCGTPGPCSGGISAGCPCGNAVAGNIPVSASAAIVRYFIGLTPGGRPRALRGGSLAQHRLHQRAFPG